MAEEDQGVPAAGGGVLKKYGPLAAIVLLVQVVLAWVVIKVVDTGSPADRDPGDPLIPQVKEQAAADQEEGTGLPYQYPSEALAKVTFNPAETNSERFAVLGITLGLQGTNDDGERMKPSEIAADPALAKVAENIPLIQTTILGVLRQKTIDDLEAANIEEVWKHVQTALNQAVFSKIEWTDDPESSKRISVQRIIPTQIIIQ